MVQKDYREEYTYYSLPSPWLQVPSLCPCFVLVLQIEIRLLGQVASGPPVLPVTEDRQLREMLQKVRSPPHSPFCLAYRCAASVFFQIYSALYFRLHFVRSGIIF